jgi:hypothetical protein
MTKADIVPAISIIVKDLIVLLSAIRGFETQVPMPRILILDYSNSRVSYQVYRADMEPGVLYQPQAYKLGGLVYNCERLHRKNMDLLIMKLFNKLDIN